LPVQLVHVTHRKTEDLSEIILFFHCVVEPSEKMDINEPLKFQEIVWLPFDTLPEDLTHVLKHALGSIKKGKLFSQFPKEEKKKKTDSVSLIESFLKNTQLRLAEEGRHFPELPDKKKKKEVSLLEPLLENAEQGIEQEALKMV
jgi:hypothetical protein